eukprot:PLAT6940.1.p3 GENE.PLAT6940.1~~PLAT6940.1.p3  ORF type:complete len:122 (+),score=57.19 PLAT6940.1:372-737(+)
MVKATTVAGLEEKHAAVADFLTIYIREAHATDGWTFPGGVQLPYVTSIDERLQRAAKLKETQGLKTVVSDTMDNQSMLTYAAWPERLYIIKDGRVIYKGGEGPYGYKPEEVDALLSKLHGD